MAYTTIVLKGDPTREDGIALTAILPGHLVEITTADNTTFQKHAVDGGIGSVAVAFEDELQGKTIQQAYALGDIIQVDFYRKGEQFLGRVKNGVAVTKGDVVCSAGGGEVRTVLPDSTLTVVEDFPLAIALATVDMSSSSGADPEGFIPLRVL